MTRSVSARSTGRSRVFGERDERAPIAVIVPDWPVAGPVRALITTRSGGVSTGPWGGPVGSGGMNVGLRLGRRADAVRREPHALACRAARRSRWLKQVHGADASCARTAAVRRAAEADAAFTDRAAGRGGRDGGRLHAGAAGRRSRALRRRRARGLARSCGRRHPGDGRARCASGWMTGRATARLPRTGDRPRPLRSRHRTCWKPCPDPERRRGRLHAARRQVHGGPVRSGTPRA